ncbi:acidic mammalian chitinase-like [Mya arenaria]|uniref:acidic mammalian chitinase-like n=1 Tax=Mya arenaria TaxID=6604 RepID=UPI0022E75C80|nr:acidic mammalian chitinase-like [Mya arenaria]
MSRWNQIKSFCYFTNWSPTLANFEARFDVENINATLCSHLIYAFANMDVVDLKLVKSEIGDDNGSLINKQGRYFEFNKLKIRNSELVTLLSIGGANGKGWFQVVASETSMQTFAKNVAIFLRDRDFDGIDLDWEYPLELYRNKFTQLLQVFRRQFEIEAMQTSKPRLLISIAVGVSEDTISKSYNIPQISSYVDYIQVMAYDFHGPWSEVTSFSSPLYSRGSNIRFNQQYSQQWAIDRWISGGAPRNKLVLGLTGIATTFTLANITDAGVGAAVAGAGKTGPYLGHEGHTTYYRVCELIRNGAVYRFDEEQKMSYVVLEDQWAGYPTPKSMKEKVRFAYSRGLAGTMFWSLEVDDFKGTYCNAGQFPLLTAVYDTIQEMAPYAASGQLTVRTTERPQITTVDIGLQHKTNKNGIHFYDMTIRPRLGKKKHETTRCS